MADDDQEPAPAGEGAEPPPAGEEPEPAPAGEEPEPAPAGEEPEPAPSGEESSDSSSDDSGSSSDDSSESGKKQKSSSGSDDSDSSDSSSDDTSKGEACVALTEDDVQSALTSALQERNVPVDDDGLKVTSDSGLFHLMVRLSKEAMPLPQVPDDTSNLAPGSVTPAQYLLQGSVETIDGGVRVWMKFTSEETSQILQAGTGTAMGTANKDAVQAAAEDALARLDMLHTQ